MSGNLRGNMIMGTVLAAFLGVLGLREAATTVYHPNYPENPGYVVAVPEAPAPGAAAEAAKPIDWGLVLADAATLPALLAKGESLHKACVACHTFDAGGANGTGPNLHGIVGRVSGTHPGFAYSEPMKAHAKPWSYEELSGFLAAPASYIKGTKMSFAGYRKPEDRVALIAFMRSQAPSTAPLPAPLPPEAAPAEGVAAPAEAPAAAPAAP